MDFTLTESQAQLVERIERLARERLRPVAAAWGERSEVCPELVAIMAEEGLFGLNIPERYGGSGGADQYCTTLCLVREALALHCSEAELIFAVQGLGTCAIVMHGSEEQKQRYLPDLVRGRRLFAFGLTEPEAGSDAAALRTTARRDGGDYVLEGRKMFISNAPDADVYVVFAKTDPEQGSRGVTAFIVEKGTPGFTPRGGIELTAPHAIGYLDFEGCRIPAENVLGEPGHGFRIALSTLDIYRPSVGAQAVGLARRAYRLARAYALERMAFGRRLADHQAIQFKLADMWIQIEAARGLVYYAAWLKDQGRRITREAAMAKLYATEAAQRVIYEAQQIHGGRGVIRGYEIERLAREARPMTIYEGTSEIQRLIIARAEAERLRAGALEEV
ncbi:MAG TPA: acyl-CoA dehydrogenase family protein [Bacillota bacterium]